MQEHATKPSSSLQGHHAVLQIPLAQAESKTVKDEYFEAVPVTEISLGEYVRKIGKDGSMLAKTYQRGAYDRVSKSYALTDCDDVNRELFVKGSVKLAIGFTY